MKPVLSIGIAACLALGALPAAASQSAFETLVARWKAVHAYEFNVGATERAGSASMIVSMHVTVDLDRRSERLAITHGPNHGSVVTWTEGGDVNIKLPGVLGVVPVHAPIRDGRFLSLRGNDLRVADLEKVLDCYAAHRSSMVEAPGPDMDGDSTTSITISDKDGIMCEGNDWPKEREVTRDELLVSNSTGWPRRRMRYEAGVPVEEWEIQDVVVRNTGPVMKPG
ncbi:MAG TPA: hypothetical protein VKG44_09835 [Candidatus Baltobacteraceae bacterium]|nr:hypothetical protein [Candidatus Baltobacteraceae bacterium]